MLKIIVKEIKGKKLKASLKGNKKHRRTPLQLAKSMKYQKGVKIIQKLVHACRRRKNAQRGDQVMMITSSVYPGKPHLTIKINGETIDALLDTGAGINLLDDKYLTLDQIKRLEPMTVVHHSASMHPLKIIGKIYVKIRCQGKDMTQQFHIIKDMHEGCLLGMEFMSSLKDTSIDLNTLQLYHRETRRPIKYLEVLLDEPVQLQPLSQTVVYTVISGIEEETPVLFEPSEKFMDKYDMAVSRAVCTPTKGKIPIKVVNFERTPMQLYPGTNMGKVEYIDCVDFIESEDDPTIKTYPPLEITNENLSIEKKND